MPAPQRARLDLIFSEGSIGSGSVPLRPFLRRMRDGSAQRRGAAQLVGRQVEVVCNAFGCDASFSDFDLGHPGESDPWRLAPELKFLMRPQLHWASQEESELAPPDHSCTGESVLQEIEVFVQRPAIETSDQRISEPIAWSACVEDLFQVGLRPTFDVSIKWCSPICVLIADSIGEPHHFGSGIVHAARIAIHLRKW